MLYPLSYGGSGETTLPNRPVARNFGGWFLPHFSRLFSLLLFSPYNPLYTSTLFSTLFFPSSSKVNKYCCL